MALTITISAQTSVTVDGIKYNIEGSNATVTYPNENKPSSSDPSTYTGNITIPPSINVDGTDYNVTAIGEESMWKCFKPS